MFPFNKADLIRIKDLYLDNTFNNPDYKDIDVLRSQVHFVIADLFTYKIEPYMSENQRKVIKLLNLKLFVM